MVTGENLQVVPSNTSCVTDEEKILCIIRDLTDPRCSGVKHSHNISASTPVATFVKDVAEKFGYKRDTINVLYSKNEGTEIVEVSLDDCLSASLREICTVGVRRHDFTISEKDGIKPEKDGTEMVSAVVESGDSQSCFTPSYSGSMIYNTGTSGSSDTYSFSSYSTSDAPSYTSSLLRSDTGFVGLVNQAMTCYLNSLLQTLYMTPEFRNALYRWEFDGSEKEEEKSIPYQLQTLFLQLQTSKKKASETTDLTKSFGWDSSEVWQQHDVQELCRVMFDALELKWRNTDQSDLINRLYQGKMKDYVKCLECGNESARVDAFLDIPLVIRPFGSSTAYGSVEEALNAFVQPEILNDTNQYFCEKCNKKCDAHKGLKFVSFPYLLTLQLKRFDFDYSTMIRIKLNDRVTFPDVLNLNHLVDEFSHFGSEGQRSGAHVEDPMTDKERVMEDSSDEGIDVGTEADLGAASGRSSPAPSSQSSDQSSTTLLTDHSISDEAVANDKNSKETDFKGPYVYELFSIMIHSGSAAGGHYYAYIKSFKDGQWYSFNDQHVSKIGYEDITKTYGGLSSNRGYYSSAYSSSANAYMLMYRQIDPDRNKDFTQPEDFPDHLKKRLERLRGEEERERLQKELEKSTCKIKAFCQHPTLRRKMEQKLEIHKDKTLADATETLYKMFKLEGIIPLDCCRIVKYDDYQDTLERSFDGEEQMSISKVLGGVKQSYNFDLLLETKRPEQEFQEYKPGGITVKVFLADLEQGVIQDPVSVRSYNEQTLEEFKKTVSEVLNVPVQHMRCVLEKFHNDLKYLCHPHKTLKSEGFFRSSKVFIEVSGAEDMSKDFFPHSQFFTLLDRYQNTIRLHVNLPARKEVSEFLKMNSRHSSLMAKALRGRRSKVTDRLTEHTSCDTTSSAKSTQPASTVKDMDEGMGETDSGIDVKMRSVTLHQSHSDPDLYRGYSHSHRHRSVSPTSSGRSRNLDFNSCQDRLHQHSLRELEKRDAHCRGESPTGERDFGATNVDLEQKDSAMDNLSDSEQTFPPSPGERDTNDLDGEEFMESCDSPKEDSPGEGVECSPQRRDLSEEATCVTNGSGEEEEEEKQHFFHVIEEDEDKHNDPNLPRVYTVMLDKRISLGAFKQELEPYMNTTADNFKVFRVYSNNQEFESVRLSETMSFFEDSKLNIKLGRALKPGEYRVKVYQLLLNEPEPCKFLIDTIFAKGMTVEESKRLILPEIKEQCNMEIPFERCRLRKKTWKNPGLIYFDSQVYEDDIQIFANWEVFVQILDEEEKMTPSQMSLFVRRWRPSTMELDPFQEVLLTQQTVEELKEKISEVSGISVENVEYAKGRGTFPCDVSVLEINKDLEWNPFVQSLNTWPLYICDDGSVLYYRDKDEKLMEISEDKKKEIQQKENIRLSRFTSRTTFSPRKEKALKIYTDEHPVSKNLSAEVD